MLTRLVWLALIILLLGGCEERRHWSTAQYKDRIIFCRQMTDMSAVFNHTCYDSPTEYKERP